MRLSASKIIFVEVHNDMFIIKKPESFNKTVRMPDELIKKLEEIANKEGISFNQLVIQCCEFALANLPKDNEIEDDAENT